MMGVDIPQVRSLIEDALKEKDISSQLKALIRSASKNESHKCFHNNKNLDLIRSSGIVEKILSVLEVKKTNSSYRSLSCESLATGVYLLVHIIKGSAFTENFHCFNGLEYEHHEVSENTLQVHISCKDFRGSSKPFPCCKEPNINEKFWILLVPFGQIVAPEQLLTENAEQTLHFVVTSLNNSTQKCQLLASSYLDWRPYLLGNPKLSKASHDARTNTVLLELQSTNPDSHLSIGTLELKLSLIWITNENKENLLNWKCDHLNYNSFLKQINKIIPKQLSTKLSQTHFDLEINQRKQREQLFIMYVRNWWHEFIHLNNGSFSKRYIKLFAMDENSQTQFVCNYVNPINSNLLLETPKLAARFVASIPCEPLHSIGTGTKERWCSGLAFVTSNRGDVPDHANLLCSLFLGYELDAYVALGTYQSSSQTDSHNLIKPYAWVIILQNDYTNVIFWDSVTGRPYLYENSNKLNKHSKYPFRTIGCIYNHKSFYANIQPTDNVTECSFDLTNPSFWHQLSSETIIMIHKYSNLYLNQLNKSIYDIHNLTIQCNQELHSMISEWRNNQLDCDCDWKWDRKLEILLHILLANFENELKNCCPTNYFETDLIFSELSKHVPKDYVFKSYPLQLLHSNPQRIFKTCLRSQMCRDILTCRGLNVHLGFCINLYSYAEQSIIAWIVFACIYKPLFEF